MHQLTKLVVAAAAARSGFPLVFLGATRGNAEFPDGGIFDARLGVIPGLVVIVVEVWWKVEWRLDRPCLTGELVDESRRRVPSLLEVVDEGGFGSGRPFKVALVDANLLTGDWE